jgi:uncharacterized protein
MFDSIPKMLLGLATGIVFGFLLQKGRVAKFPVIVGQFLLRDWTVLKIIITAVAVGSAGVWAMVHFGWVEVNPRPLALAGVIIGGALFGFGMVLLGYCPGTTVAACAQGYRDAMVGFGGMLVGAATYVWFFPALSAASKSLGDWGKVTLPQMTGTSVWIWVGGLALAAIAIYFIGRRTRLLGPPSRIREPKHA